MGPPRFRCATLIVIVKQATMGKITHEQQRKYGRIQETKSRLEI
ncbi:unnamed protein product [Linum tenue]|uniref:Uncharacterized protein n=1 Tax=Linum tenue TaxID=586396 RepID=A0AAV0M5H5_9ROSI|nr:unnamed protein product [Linum tenue]